MNVLINGFRRDAPGHAEYREYLRALTENEEPYGMSELVLSGFLRIMTSPRAFAHSPDVPAALAFVDALRSRPNCVPIRPGPNHWPVFLRLCHLPGVRGKMVADAYHAAIAIEAGCEWVTDDSDFARFPGLRWRRPLS